MRSFRDMINESSTLSGLGANSTQIKAIYQNREWTEFVPKADAKWEELKSKKDVIDLLKSKNDGRPSVVGFDKEGTMYIVVAKDYFDDGKKYEVNKIDKNGKSTEWFENSPNKALSYFKGVKKYFYSKQAGVTPKTKSEYYDPDSEDGRYLINKIAELIEKDYSKMYFNAKKKIGEQAKKLIDSGDFGKAKALLDKVVDSHNEDIEFRDFVRGPGWAPKNIKSMIVEQIRQSKVVSGDRFGIIPRLDKMSKNSSPKEIRSAAVEVLKILKDDMDKYLNTL